MLNGITRDLSGSDDEEAVLIEGSDDFDGFRLSEVQEILNGLPALTTDNSTITLDDLFADDDTEAMLKVL